jgi:hypothetical protein
MSSKKTQERGGIFPDQGSLKAILSNRQRAFDPDLDPEDLHKTP